MRTSVRGACRICREAIPQPRTGRTRVTCSAACRQKLYLARHPEKKRKSKSAAWRRAEKKVREFERKFGDLSSVPGGRAPGMLNLRKRLLVNLSLNAPLGECWNCGRPYIIDGRRTETCSTACTRKRHEYFEKLKRNFYDHPRQLPDDVKATIRLGKKLQFCARCDDPFVPTRPNRKYCTSRCRKAAYDLREGHKARKKRLAARRLAARRTQYHRSCADCGTAFSTTNSRKLYCKQECKVRAGNKRQHPVEYRDCVECGTQFEVNKRHRSVHYHCSPTCLTRSMERGKHPASLGYRRRCVLCGREYKPHQAKQAIQIYCTQRCTAAAWKIAEEGWGKVFGQPS